MFVLDRGGNALAQREFSPLRVSPMTSSSSVLLTFLLSLLPTHNSACGEPFHHSPRSNSVWVYSTSVLPFQFQIKPSPSSLSQSANNLRPCYPLPSGPPNNSAAQYTNAVRPSDLIRTRHYPGRQGADAYDALVSLHTYSANLPTE